MNCLQGLYDVWLLATSLQTSSMDLKLCPGSSV